MIPKPTPRSEDSHPQALAKPRPARARLCGKALVVDDNALQRSLFAKILGSFGLTVAVAVDGLEAVEAVTQGTETFDLMLTDIQMPTLDGVAATKCIRAFEAAHPERTRLPIIALTANGFADEIEGYLAAGMDRHLLKPIDVPKLYETIAAFVPTQAEQSAN